MSQSNTARPATGSVPSPGGTRPEPIKAIKLRHPWRIVFAAILILLLVWFIVDASQREAYGWQYVGKYVFDRRISAAALVTLQLT
ncbi:MAG: amino acid ABC transporter permease, partial [Leifsonia sp.]|nr:amino acid ABC transporter permease [Leifsonia sp.]